MSELTRPFWDAARDGRLIAPKCDVCGRKFFRPEVACTHCFSTNWSWTESTGAGSLYTFSVIWRAPIAGFPSPSILAVVDLDDGWTMFSSIEKVAPEDVSIGMRLRVFFDPVTPDRFLPRFMPY